MHRILVVHWDDRSKGTTFFSIDDDGLTATRKVRDADVVWRFICMSTRLDKGKPKPQGARPSNVAFCIDTGVHEATFRVLKCDNLHGIGLGVVPASQTASDLPASSIGFMYCSNGEYWALDDNTYWAADYGVGDVISARLNLNERTISFRKNGADVGSPQKVPRSDDGGYFAFESFKEGNAVTIVDDEGEDK